MEKGEGWRVFAWVGWMTFAFTHAQAQTQTFDSLQVGATWWWGDLDQWTLAKEDSLWTLDATSEGPHVLCGCQLGVSEQSLVALQWPPLTRTARPRRCSSGMHTLKKTRSPPCGMA